MSGHIETTETGRIPIGRDCSWPFVSVIMPVLNEERYVMGSLTAVLEQDYPSDRLEIIIADGLSTDRTREIVESIQREHANVRLIENPGRIVPTGLNLALKHARGEIIVRLDGHCVYPPDYIRRVVELRERTKADSAGGVLVPIGDNYTSESVAAAYYFPIGLGNALKGHPASEALKEVDTVHGGCWRRERLFEVGLFDERMVRNQDDELSFRLRKSSGRIVQSSAIRVQYSVRDSFRKLFMQFAQYGYWKVRVVEKHPRQASLRHFIPALFLLSVLASALVAPFHVAGGWFFLGLTCTYLSALVLGGLYQAARTKISLWPGITLALFLMHMGYGWGFLVGEVRKLTGPLPTDRIFERVTR